MGYEVLHAFLFKLDYSATIIKLFLVLLLSYTIVNMLKDRFIKVFIHTMYIISIVSFVFTVLCYVPGINRALYNLAIDLFPLEKDFKNYMTPTLIAYTFHPEFFDGRFSYARNPAIFWEGGAFAVYLNIVLYFHYLTKKVTQFKDLFDRKSLVFIIALLSTASTMGFFAWIVLLAFFTLQIKSNFKYFAIVLVVLSAYIAFGSFDFLGDKVKAQLEVSEKDNNRFGSALMDFEDIMEKPVFGWSRRIEVLFKTSVYSAKSHRPNGFTNFIRSYGFFYTTVYFCLVFASFKQIAKFHDGGKAKRMAFFGVLMLCVVSFSELIFDAAFLKSLLFLYVVYLPVQVVQEKVKPKERVLKLT
jgi:hypothetical protein